MTDLPSVGVYYACAGHWTLAARAAGMDVLWHDAVYPKLTRILDDNFTGEDGAQAWVPTRPASAVMDAEEELRADWIVGSPPCYGYVRAAQRHNRISERRVAEHAAARLRVLDFALKARALARDGFVMEMVREFDAHPFRAAYLAFLRGWDVREVRVDAWEFGGTQRRIRTFRIGTRRRDLPPLLLSRRPGRDPVAAVRAIGNDPGWTRPLRGAGPFNAIARFKAGDDRRRLKSGRPSPTVTMMAERSIFHWRDDRGLGNRETAALMGFPPEYRLPYGKESARGPIAGGVDVRAAAEILRQVAAWRGTWEEGGS